MTRRVMASFSSGGAEVSAVASVGASDSQRCPPDTRTPPLQPPDKLLRYPLLFLLARSATQTKFFSFSVRSTPAKRSFAPAQPLCPWPSALYYPFPKLLRYPPAFPWGKGEKIRDKREKGKERGKGRDVPSAHEKIENQPSLGGRGTATRRVVFPTAGRNTILRQRRKYRFRLRSENDVALRQMMLCFA